MWETLDLHELCELHDPRFAAPVRALAVMPDEASIVVGNDGACFWRAPFPS
jgi:hypothetical protein